MAKITLKSIREGSIVKVRGGFGGGKLVKATIDNVESDIKNGMPGADYTVLDSKEQHWCYLEQIDSVVTY